MVGEPDGVVGASQLDELARTPEQLQELVARFHAEVGDGEYPDHDDDDGPHVPRRRADDWAPAPRADSGYVSRAN